MVRLKMAVLCAVVGRSLLGGSAVGGEERPVNVWQALGDGEFPLTGRYPNLIGCGLVWLPHEDAALVAPMLDERQANFRVLPFENPRWVIRSGTYPEGRVPDQWESPRAYCYLPGLKKVLYLKQEWRYAKDRRPTAGWLADPVGGAWEPLESDLCMSDRSADFNPAPGRDGLRLPIWGALCYDGHNHEALAFGGGGVWGRVGLDREPVKPADWIFDEAAKRTRRLLRGEAGPSEARRWFPAHLGTWVFPETEKVWKRIEQPLGLQPSGRIIPGMAYDAGERKIVLFGGDDLARCLNDTWVYDCRTRTWTEVKPKTMPQARAGHAMVYVPEQKAVFMAGGYAGGWRTLKDVWVFETAKNEWTRLGFDLPIESGSAAADYDPKRGLVLMAIYPQPRSNRRVPVYTLRLDVASAPKPAAEPSDPVKDWHCKAWTRWPSLLPEEWEAGVNTRGDLAQQRAELLALPANAWVRRRPPVSVPVRGWGSAIYDPKTHTGFLWGGGHGGYWGSDISEYDLLANRWGGMADPTKYAPIWLHGMAGGPPGVSFGGWSLLPCHARKSYGVDPLSDTVVNFIGDVYSPKHHLFFANIGRCPGAYGFSDQVAFVTAPHGVYGYVNGMLHRADVKGGRWREVAKGGPPDHHEFNHMCYDAKRDRILYFVFKTADVWSFDFRSKKWSEEKPTGGKPPKAPGDSTYIADLDAALLVFSEAETAAEKKPERLWFYKCDERKWYWAPHVGAAAFPNTTSLDHSPAYDPELKLVVRFYHADSKWQGVQVLRLDPAALRMTPME